jgi:hypothetical protein
MSGGFFKGTSLEQDSRFADKQAKLLSKMAFPPEYERKVDVSKVKLDVIKPWSARTNKQADREWGRHESEHLHTTLVCMHQTLIVRLFL